MLSVCLELSCAKLLNFYCICLKHENAMNNKKKPKEKQVKTFLGYKRENTDITLLAQGDVLLRKI